MPLIYESIFYSENAHIKERLSPTTIEYIRRLKQHVQNINIYFYGSITNFTHFKNSSDVDCCIVYPDEYTKDKLIQFVTEDSIQFHIKRIKVIQLKISCPEYKDEFYDVYCLYFDNGDKIDFTLVGDNIGPILEKRHDNQILFLILLYIVKFLYYHANIISKDIFVRLKRMVFGIKSFFSKNTTTILHKTNMIFSDSSSYYS